MENGQSLKEIFDSCLSELEKIERTDVKVQAYAQVADKILETSCKLLGL